MRNMFRDKDVSYFNDLMSELNTIEEKEEAAGKALEELAALGEIPEGM